MTTDAGVDAFSIDSSSGALSPAPNGHIDGHIDSVAVDGTGGFLYVLSAPPAGYTLAVYAIDPSTGALKKVTQVIYAPLGGQAFDYVLINPSSGYIYIVDQGSYTVRGFVFDSNTHALTVLPFPPTTLTGGTSGYTLAFDGSGGFLVVAYSVGAGSMISVFGVSAQGALTPMGAPTNAGPAATSGIVSEPTGRFLYASNVFALTGYRLHAGNGAVSQLAGGPLATGGQLDPIITIPGNY